MEDIELFCSIIIPTVNRPSLAQTVESILTQPFAHDHCEIIVVNDSGNPLSYALWQQSPCVQIIHTNQRERSVARNTGAALARGEYLLFLDDDDWLLPYALQNFWQLAQSTEAGWLYGGTQIVDRHARPLLQLHHGLHGNCFLQVLAGEWIPLQASLIRAKAFFKVGGFNPLLAGPEDIDLLRRIALQYDLAEIPDTVACLTMGQDGSTTDYDRHPERSRWAREMVLDAAGTLARMKSSASSSFWYGRIVRAYLTSVVWNLQHRRLWTAVSRANHAIYVAGTAGIYLFSPYFWQAILKPYNSETFTRGLLPK